MLPTRRKETASQSIKISSRISYHRHNITEILFLWHKTTNKENLKLYLDSVDLALNRTACRQHGFNDMGAIYIYIYIYLAR